MVNGNSAASSMRRRACISCWPPSLPSCSTARLASSSSRSPLLAALQREASSRVHASTSSNSSFSSSSRHSLPRSSLAVLFPNLSSPHQPRGRPLATTGLGFSQARTFAHLANSNKDAVPETKKLQQLPAVPPIPTSTGKGKSPDSSLSASSAPTDATPSGKVTGNKEQRLQDIQIVKRLLPNIWPKGDRATKTRVLVALGLLVGGKVGGD